MSRFFKEYSYYFITVPTIYHQKFFDSNFKKDILLNRLLTAKVKFSIQKLYFGINADHYHLLGYFTQWHDIPRFLNFINGGSSFDLNKTENSRSRKIWDEYHFYLIETEEALYQIKGYVIGNPYKHGEVELLEGLQNYKYSSFQQVLGEEGLEVAKNMVMSSINLRHEDIIKQLKLSVHNLA